MKRFLLLSKMLSLLVCFSLVSSANVSPPGPWPYDYHPASGSVIGNYLTIPYVDPAEAPYIDGDTAGDIWNFYPPIGMYVYTDKATPEGQGGAVDFSSFFRVMYNEDAIYILVTVVDDILFNTGANSYEQDCIEIYFDGGNEDAASYDANDIQWRWVYGYPVDSLGIPGNWADCGYWVWSETDNGYQFELRISQDSLEKAGNPLFDLSVEGDTIGFEVQVADNDTNVRDWISKWWSESNNSWLEPILFGTALLGDQEVSMEEAATLQIPGINSPIFIDGDTEGDFWDSVPRVHMTVNTDGDLPDGGFAEFSSYFKVAFATNAFYFFGEVYDDLIYNSGANPWEQDCIEIYFDGDNSKGGSYDANDIQWRWVYGYPADSVGKEGWADAGYWAWEETPYGYTFELRISADSLEKEGIQLFNLASGIEIGFEVQVNDNDTGALDCISKWWSNSNNSSSEPALFGTAMLYPEGGISEPTAENIELSIPSVLNGNAIISYSIPARSSVALNFYNIAGQVVRPVFSGERSAGTYTLYVDVSDLANGVYLCRLEACNTSTTRKVLMIK